MSIDSLLREKKLIICCGSGGVGKTTLSATLGVRAASLGRKVIVLTIDPARRLANSLGLQSIDHEEREIPKSLFEAAGFPIKGELSAIMLDTKRTFDRIIEKYTPNEASRNQIFENPLYQHLSSMIAGSQEYMAMEKVFELYEKNKYDLLILDTPPTQHALDFLDAPQKMTRAVTESMLHWLLKPTLFMGKFSLRILERGASRIFKAFDKVIGFEFLKDLSAMLISTAGLLEGFRERATEVASLLKSDSTAFLLVSAPHQTAIEEGVYFYEKIHEYALPFKGILVNRVHLLEDKTETVGWEKRGKRSEWSDEEVLKINQVLKNWKMLCRQDAESIDILKKNLSSKEFIIQIPLLDSDVHDLKGLIQVSHHLS